VNPIRSHWHVWVDASCHWGEKHECQCHPVSGNGGCSASVSVVGHIQQLFAWTHRGIKDSGFKTHLLQTLRKTFLETSHSMLSEKKNSLSCLLTVPQNLVSMKHCWKYSGHSVGWMELKVWHDAAVKVLILSSTTYLCEAGFSAMTRLNTKYRARLSLKTTCVCQGSLHALVVLLAGISSSPHTE